MSSVKDIINEKKIFDILEKTCEPSRKEVLGVLKKAEKKRGLKLEEVAWLVNTESKELTERMFKIAGKIKKEIYGERLVLFAPLYVSNFCVNDCEYCGFHLRNPAKRKKLTLKQVENQVKILEDMGHKRLLLEFGEDPKENPINYVVDVIKTIYNTKSDKGEIRRVNVNIAATTTKNYKKLKKAGIGTYQLFQETYHYPTYKKMHKGPKADYQRQLFAHDRAFNAGIDDVGLGVLFGLYDWRFEVLALVSHAQYLDKRFGVGPHTFSVPRIQPAESVNTEPPYPVSEDELLKIIAILRLAVPCTGMIISTRERPGIRAKAFEIGISQTSAASCTSPGGYTKEPRIKNPAPKGRGSLNKIERQESRLNVKQFRLSDERSLDDVLLGLLKQDLLPSFCTACYRNMRTGKAFMDLAKPGNIQNFCRPNAILTFKEYLEDYASGKVKKTGLEIINKYIEKIPNPDTRKKTKKYLKRIEEGERDLYI